MPDESVDCGVTSPPYFGLRDYGVVGQLGLEETPEEYVAKIVEGFGEFRRVLKKEGTLWLNIGDGYATTGKNRTEDQASAKSTLHGSLKTQMQSLKQRSKIVGDLKPKDLIGIPWMVAFALRSSGWYLRQDIIWHKPNPMPESVTDRCTKAHEYLFMFSKSERYYYDETIKIKYMPEENISAKCKIIDDFMGKSIGMGCFNPYDVSWELLMSVVEAIERMDYGFKMCRKRVEFYRDSDKKVILDIKMGSRIESLFYAVYEAVQWLQKQKA